MLKGDIMYLEQCNKCGQAKNTTHINISFGYGSKFDTEAWQLNLCDDCLEEFVEKCSYTPQGFGVNGYEDYWKACQVDCK